MEDSSGLVPLDSVGGPRGGGGRGGRPGGRPGGHFGRARRPPFRRPPLPPPAPYYGPALLTEEPVYNAIDPITGEPYYDPALDTAALAAPAAAPYATGRSRQMLGARAGLGISNLGAPRGGYGRGLGASYGGQGTMIPLGTSAATSAAAPGLLRQRLLQQRALQQQAALQQAAMTQAALTPTYGGYGGYGGYSSLINPISPLGVNPYSTLGYNSAAAPLLLMGLTESQAGEVGSLPGMASELDGYATYGNPGFAQSPPRCWRMR